MSKTFCQIIKSEKHTIKNKKIKELEMTNEKWKMRNEKLKDKNKKLKNSTNTQVINKFLKK